MVATRSASATDRSSQSGTNDACWRSFEPVFADNVRIHPGSAEPVVHLMSHDWHTEDRGTPCHQNHVRDGFVGYGPWAVDVRRAGS